MAQDDETFHKLMGVIITELFQQKTDRGEAIEVNAIIGSSFDDTQNRIHMLDSVDILVTSFGRWGPHNTQNMVWDRNSWG